MTMRVVVSNPDQNGYVAVVTKQVTGSEPGTWVDSAEDKVRIANGESREWHIYSQTRIIVEESTNG